MSIITKQELQRFAELGNQTESDDPMVISKLRTYSGSCAWYLTSYNPETETLYGFVTGFSDDGEWEHITLEEVYEMQVKFQRHPFLRGIRRDHTFKETRFSKLGL
ncbi:MAG: DUF2958 domain-containing protein [Minisyncoccia bacterium]